MRLWVPMMFLLGGCGSLVYQPPSQGESVRRRTGNPHREIHRVYRMARLLGAQSVGSPQVTRLANGVQAQMVILQRTKWSLKLPGQSVQEDMRRRHAYMKLPEVQRRQHMDRQDDFMQIWWVSLSDTPAAGAALKKQLQFTGRPHQHRREVAFLGKDDHTAWYVFAPIPTWIQLQRTQKLKGGDDPIAAAIRGMAVKDAGTWTGFGCYYYLGEVGPAAVKQVTRAIAGRLPQRANAVRAVGQHPSTEVGRWLVKLTASADPLVAGAAKRALLSPPRAMAKDLYVKWLEDLAGKKPVLKLLRAIDLLDAKEAAGSLPVIMKSPESVAEYRLAFTLSRRFGGSALPAGLLAAERSIHQYGAGGEIDQTKVDAAVQAITSAGDPEAAAIIGVSLAIFRSKGDVRAVKKAGMTILRSLPKRAGLKLAAHLTRALRGTDLIAVQKVTSALRGHSGRP